MRVRNAVPQDVPLLVRLGEQLHEESDYPQYPFNPEKVYTYLDELVKSNDGIVVVGEDEGCIVGVFVGCIGSHWFGDCTVSYDLALFVVPDRRGSILGARLIKEYIRIASSMGIDEILIGNATAVRLDRVEMVERLHERTGFRRRSGNYRFVGEMSLRGPFKASAHCDERWGD